MQKDIYLVSETGEACGPYGDGDALTIVRDTHYLRHGVPTLIVHRVREKDIDTAVTRVLAYIDAKRREAASS